MQGVPMTNYVPQSQPQLIPITPQTGLTPIVVPMTTYSAYPPTYMPMSTQQFMMNPQLYSMQPPMTGMMPQMMPQQMMIPTQTMMIQPPTSGIMPQMMSQQYQQQQTKPAEEKKQPVEEVDEGPKFQKESDEIKVSVSKTKMGLLSVRRLNIRAEGFATLEIEEIEADFVSVDVTKCAKVRIHRLNARRLEVFVSSTGKCKIGTRGAAKSKVDEQEIRVSERGKYDGRLCPGKNIGKHVTGFGRALIRETDGMRVFRKK